MHLILAPRMVQCSSSIVRMVRGNHPGPNNHFVHITESVPFFLFLDAYVMLSLENVSKQDQSSLKVNSSVIPWRSSFTKISIFWHRVNVNAPVPNLLTKLLYQINQYSWWCINIILYIKQCSNLELELGAATINADWATGAANYYKIGKQCVVNALVTLKQDTTVNNTLLISGLPISAQEKVCLIYGTTGYGVFKVLANTGNITIDSGAKGNSIFYFEMIYLTKWLFDSDNAHTYHSICEYCRSLIVKDDSHLGRGRIVKIIPYVCYFCSGRINDKYRWTYWKTNI